MTTATASAPQAPELDRLVSTETELEAMLARARHDSASLIEQAGAEARNLAVRQQAELEDLLARRRSELEALRSEREQRIADEAKRTAERYEGISDEMVARLAGHVLAELNREDPA